MNKKIIFLSFSGLLALSLCLNSCGSEEGKDDKGKKGTKVDTTAGTDSVADLPESIDDDYMLPSPMQVAHIFEDAGLSYNTNWMNPVENVELYTGKSKKQFVFGVYSADLAYAVMNNKNSEAKEYMKVVKQLADNSGLNAVFDGSDLMTKFEKSIGNKDEMVNVMIEIQESTDDYLLSNNKKHLGVIHFSGAWIEGISLGARDAIENNNTKLAQELSQQMVILENLIKGLKAQPEADAFTSEIISDFQKIYSTFNSLESVKSYDETTQTLTLTDAEMKQISELVLSTREKIVKV